MTNPYIIDNKITNKFVEAYTNEMNDYIAEVKKRIGKPG